MGAFFRGDAVKLGSYLGGVTRLTPFSYLGSSPTNPTEPTTGQLLGWQISSANIGLAGAGVNKNSLTLYTGPSELPRGTTLTLMKITVPIEMYNGDCTLDRCWIVPNSLGAPVGALVSTIRYIGDQNVESVVGNNLVKDCEIDGDTSLPLTDQLATGCSVAGVPTLLRNDIHGMGSGVAHIVTGSTLSAVMTNNYVHGCRGLGDPATTGSHNEAYTVRDFNNNVNPSRSIRLIGNRMECQTGANDTGTLFIQPLWEPVFNMYIEDNYLEGGGYNLYVENHGSNGYGNINVKNNRFRPTGYGAATVASGPGWKTFVDNYIYAAGNADGKGALVQA